MPLAPDRCRMHMKKATHSLGVRGLRYGTVHYECNELARHTASCAQVNAGRSRGLVLGFGLQAVEIIHGLLGMRCGAEDRALVILEDG